MPASERPRPEDTDEKPAAKPSEESQWARFEALADKLVKVPKRELDARRVRKA